MHSKVMHLQRQMNMFQMKMPLTFVTISFKIVYWTILFS